MRNKNINISSKTTSKIVLTLLLLTKELRELDLALTREKNVPSILSKYPLSKPNSLVNVSVNFGAFKTWQRGSPVCMLSSCHISYENSVKSCLNNKNSLSRQPHHDQNTHWLLDRSALIRDRVRHIKWGIAALCWFTIKVYFVWTNWRSQKNQVTYKSERKTE